MAIKFLVFVFYCFLIRLFFLMPVSPIWSINDHKIDFWIFKLFQRLMELSDNDSRC